MGKKWLGIGLLLVLSCLCALFLPVDLFPLDKMTQDMAFDADGSVYMTANDDSHSRIIAADSNGRVQYAYQEDSRAQERATAIGPLAVSDGQVFFIRRFGNTRLASFDGWELVRLDMASGETEVLCTDRAENLDVTGLSVSDRMVYLAGIGQASRAGVRIDTIELYRLNLEEEDGELLSVTEANAPEGKSVVTAVHGGGSTLCALLSDGTLVYTVGQTLQTVALEDGDAPLSGLCASNRYLWARGAQPGVFLTGTSNRLRAREIDGTVLSGAATSNLLALRVYTEDGKTALARTEGEDVRLMEELQVPLDIRLEVRWPAVLITAAVVLVLALLVLGVLHFVAGHRLRSRMTAAVTGLAALFFVALVLLASGVIWQSEQGGTEQTAQWYAQNLASTLSYSAVADGAEAQSALNEAGEADVQVDYVVYALQDGMQTPVYLSRDGLVANADLMQCVVQTNEHGYLTGGSTTLDGRRTSLCAVPVRQAGQMTAILAVAVSGAEKPLLGTGGLGLFLLLALLLFAVLAVILTLLIRRYLRPLVPLAAQMDRLAIGDTNLDEINCADDELGRLWQSLKELSVGMAIRDYELNATLESCRRFVPHSMEQLLDRGTVTEVHCGDLVAADGSLGLIAFGDSERMRAALSDRDFMDYVNRCFLSLSHSIWPRGGVLLTGGFDLSAVRVLFKQSPDQGVRALLNLLDDKGSDSSNCFALLHKAHFLYGVAGTEDEAFPYLASSEVSFFTGKLPQLVETGCRLVVTDAFLQTLSEHFSTRYIGFFSSEDGKTMYKLHEVLDCYGELERNKREQYDAHMQEAIRCFYQNDFYLARNLFLAILRLSPTDGVARWYLFACEHYFNAGAGEEARYDLFGI